jgi:hypothetical protein
MSDFKTTPIKNSYELMIDRLKAVISDKDAEIARLKAENERLLRELKRRTKNEGTSISRRRRNILLRVCRAAYEHYRFSTPIFRNEQAKER